MKLSETFEDAELSRSVLRSLEDVIEQVVNELVDGYDTQLFKDGKALPTVSKRALKSSLRNRVVIKLAVSATINEKLLDDLDIYPQSIDQTLLMSFTPEELVKVGGNEDAND